MFSFQHHEQEYMCAKTSSMEHCTGASSPGNQAGKRNKKHETGQEEVQLSPCAADTTLYKNMMSQPETQSSAGPLPRGAVYCSSPWHTGIVAGRAVTHRSEQEFPWSKSYLVKSP